MNTSDALMRFLPVYPDFPDHQIPIENDKIRQSANFQSTPISQAQIGGGVAAYEVACFRQRGAMGNGITQSLIQSKYTPGKRTVGQTYNPFTDQDILSSNVLGPSG